MPTRSSCTSARAPAADRPLAAIRAQPPSGSRRRPVRWIVAAPRPTSPARNRPPSTSSTTATPGRPPTPPRPFERGVDGEGRRSSRTSRRWPTWRSSPGSGAAWYRELGGGATRARALVTVGGVAAPGVREIALGTPIGDLAERRRRHQPGTRRPPRRLLRRLAGGPRRLGPAARSRRCCAPAGTPSAAASSPSCRRRLWRRADGADPRLHGRARAPRSADPASSAFARSPTRPHAWPAARPPATTWPGSTRWSGQLAGRGACRHPDGAVGLLQSALRVFGDEFAAPPAHPDVRPADRRGKGGLTGRAGVRLDRGSIDRIRCDGYGMCAELLPERIELDDWGYPIVPPGAVPDELLEHARRAVAVCPVLALQLRAAPAPPAGTPGPPALERSADGRSPVPRRARAARACARRNKHRGNPRPVACVAAARSPSDCDVTSRSAARSRSSSPAPIEPWCWRPARTIRRSPTPSSRRLPPEPGRDRGPAAERARHREGDPRATLSAAPDRRGRSSRSSAWAL